MDEYKGITIRQKDGYFVALLGVGRNKTASSIEELKKIIDAEIKFTKDEMRKPGFAMSEKEKKKLGIANKNSNITLSQLKQAVGFSSAEEFVADTQETRRIFRTAGGGEAMVIKRGSAFEIQYKNSASFSNGCARAEAYLNSRMKEVGVRLENVNTFVIRETSKGFDVLLKGDIVYQSYNREEAERWARNNKRTPFGYDESSAPK